MSRVGQSLQQEAALQFAAFAVQGACGPGTLTVEWDGDQSALAPAVVGRGGVCLSIYADREKAKAAARLGATDFTVDGLSEALRILKNEVRQQRPIAVGLVGDAAALAREMLERGVQPAMVAADAAVPWSRFAERGAAHLAIVTSEGLRQVLVQGRLRSDVADTARERRERDAVLLAAADVPGLRGIARQWLELAPRLFPRDPVRWFWAANERVPPSEEELRLAIAEASRFLEPRCFADGEEGLE